MLNWIYQCNTIIIFLVNLRSFDQWHLFDLKILIDWALKMISFVEFPTGNETRDYQKLLKLTNAIQRLFELKINFDLYRGCDSHYSSDSLIESILTDGEKGAQLLISKQKVDLCAGFFTF